MCFWICCSCVIKIDYTILRIVYVLFFVICWIRPAVCYIASYRLHGFSRISVCYCFLFLISCCFSLKKHLFSAFFGDSLTYCPLVRMCHKRTFSSKIKRLHEKRLRQIYKIKDSKFCELQKKDYHFLPQKCMNFINFLPWERMNYLKAVLQ